MDTLDPVLVKAIKLMHSTSKSSTDQLKALLDDALLQRRSQLQKLPEVKVKKIYTFPSAEKRPFDVKVREAADVVHSLEKKRKMMQVISTPNKSRSLSSSPDPRSGSMSLSEAKDLFKETSHGKGIKQEDDSEATDTEDNDKESDSDKNVSSQDMAVKREEESFTSLEDFGDLACVTCGSMEQRPGNSLVECQECHSLYHQECHKPPATNQEILDPRTIWYCAKCTKTMKKSSSVSSSNAMKGKGVTSTSLTATSQSSKVATTASSAFEAAINQGKESALILVKERQNKKVTESTASTAPSFSFKRTEAKPSASSSSTTTSKPIGLAGLAANTTSRLQQMKKKAKDDKKKK